MKENQPKHRQLRKAQRKLARRKASREGFPAILIVCEGRETEPNYIRGLCEALHINLAGVKIHAGTHATDAAVLVKRAQRLFAVDRDFDHVYVVCDHGALIDTAGALAQKPLRRLDGKRITVTMICTRPCFEFWLLLHFEYSSRPYTNSAEVIANLCAHLTDYDKADRHIFAKVASGLDLAVERVEQLKQQLAQDGAAEPDTDMHELVRQLLSMRRPT